MSDSNTENSWFERIKKWQTILTILAIVLGLYISVQSIMNNFYSNELIWHGEIINKSTIKLSPTNSNIRVEFARLIFPEELANTSITHLSPPDFSLSLDSLEIEIVKNLIKPETKDTLGGPALVLKADILRINGLPVGIESQYILDGRQYSNRSLYWIRLQMNPKVRVGNIINRQGRRAFEVTGVEISSINFLFLNDLTLTDTETAVENKWRQIRDLDL